VNCGNDEAVSLNGAAGPGRTAAAASLRSLYECLDARADALFEVADAVLCADHAVTSQVQLSLEPEFTRGHGALYDALAAGESTTSGSSPCWQRNFRRPLTARRPATWPGAGPPNGESARAIAAVACDLPQ
jgi:hypothetical protein